MENLLNYKIVFKNNNNTNQKYFNVNFEYCKNWIEKHNGTNYSYFDEYKNGTVSIVQQNTQEVVFETEIITN